jgi:hypothetical protein
VHHSASERAQLQEGRGCRSSVQARLEGEEAGRWSTLMHALPRSGLSVPLARLHADCLRLITSAVPRPQRLMIWQLRKDRHSPSAAVERQTVDQRLSRPRRLQIDTVWSESRRFSLPMVCVTQPSVPTQRSSALHLLLHLWWTCARRERRWLVFSGGACLCLRLCLSVRVHATCACAIYFLELPTLLLCCRVWCAPLCAKSIALAA